MQYFGGPYPIFFIVCVEIPRFFKGLLCHMDPHRMAYFWGIFFRVARLQNETAPETFLIRCKKGFEKREKRSEKRSEMRPKSF